MSSLSKIREFNSQLDSFTPKNGKYEDYISNFTEETTYTFLVDVTSVDVDKVYDLVAKYGFLLIEERSVSKNVHMFRIKEL